MNVKKQIEKRLKELDSEYTQLVKENQEYQKNMIKVEACFIELKKLYDAISEDEEANNSENKEDK